MVIEKDDRTERLKFVDLDREEWTRTKMKNGNGWMGWYGSSGVVAEISSFIHQSLRRVDVSW